MLRLAADECVNADIINGARRELPDIDILTVQEAGIRCTPDPQVLEWAAAQGRILITDDVNTLVGYAWRRVERNEPMPGVLAIVAGVSVGVAIEAILMVAQYATAEEMYNQVKYITSEGIQGL